MTDESSTSFESADHDVFDDSVAASQATEQPAEPEAKTEEIKSEEPATQEADKTEDQTQTQETGEKQETEATPAEAQDGEKDQSDKMIPEHRFKAALKDVTDRLDAAQAELAQMKQQPAPDRNADPDGYDLHIRVETSKAIMAETHEDYNEVMQRYIEMEKANPAIAQVVAAHQLPAKYAYDLAKKDMEIRELSTLKTSDEWAEFQAFKKMKAENAEKEAQAAVAAAKQEQQKQTKTEAISKVPNLNRATDVSTAKDQNTSTEDDELFAGAL